MRIPLHTRCQSRRRGTLSGSVDGNGRDLLDELEQLRFGGTGVAEHEDVDVASEAHAVGEDLLRAAHEETGDGLLDVCGAEGADEQGKREAERQKKDEPVLPKIDGAILLENFS